jgi:hypothetical protein
VARALIEGGIASRVQLGFEIKNAEGELVTCGAAKADY